MKTYQVTYHTDEVEQTEQIQADYAVVEDGFIHFYRKGQNGPFRGISLQYVIEYREVNTKSTIREEWINKLKNPNLSTDGMSVAQAYNWDMVEKWIQNNKKNSTND